MYYFLTHSIIIGIYEYKNGTLFVIVEREKMQKASGGDLMIVLIYDLESICE